MNLENVGRLQVHHRSDVHKTCIYCNYFFDSIKGTSDIENNFNIYSEINFAKNLISYES